MLGSCEEKAPGAAASLVKHSLLGRGTGRVVHSTHNCKLFIGQQEGGIASKARRIVFFLRVYLFGQKFKRTQDAACSLIYGGLFFLCFPVSFLHEGFTDGAGDRFEGTRAKHASSRLHVCLLAAVPRRWTWAQAAGAQSRAWEQKLFTCIFCVLQAVPTAAASVVLQASLKRFTLRALKCCSFRALELRMFLWFEAQRGGHIL